ncbi:MAG TPA: hypothetical protein VFZ78_11130 [Flavisolibacter sp.]
MKKFLLVSAATCMILAAAAQATLVSGNSQSFVIKKQPQVSVMSNDNEHYFVVRTSENPGFAHSLVTVDRSGNVSYAGTMKVNPGTFTNSMEIHSLQVVGNSLVALMENRDKKAGLNRLIVRLVDNTGTMSIKEEQVGALEYEKMMNPGNWFVTATPDRKHLAVIGQMPFEKGQQNQYKFFMVDASLKVIQSGKLSFPDDTKRMHFQTFAASNSGDLYLISDDFDKGYKYPVIYRASTTKPAGTITRMEFRDAADRLANYVTTIADNGDLVLAGYYKKKRVVTTDNEENNGTFLYNAATGQLQTHAFDRPLYNLKARGLVRNGNTQFLVGEQHKTENKGSAPSTPFEYNYLHQHSDILVSAFDEAGNRKFQIPLNKNFSAMNADQDLYPAFGIVNGKLAIAYNDQYGKYFTGTSYTNSKLPVVVFINNDGLMEQPVNFEKEWQVSRNSYTLYPGWYSNSNGVLVMLSGNGSSLRGVVIK